ncbi:AbrB/MazE/SpoVT family DNA-binding domain-containing protein [Nitrospira sp. Nam80]
MIKKLQKHGNSMALLIEKPMMEALGIGEDTPLQVNISGQSLVVTPADVGIGKDRVMKSVSKMRRRYGSTLKRLAG